MLDTLAQADRLLTLLRHMQQPSPPAFADEQQRILKAYDAFETQRFVSYYEEAAADSAVRLAGDTITVALR